MKKNVVLIMLDSLQFNYLGCYGNEWIKTPNIDNLAKEATLFENEYRRGSQGEETLYAVTTTRLQQRDYAGTVEICDRHFETQWASGKFSNNCGLAYGAVGRTAEAESALLFATKQRKGKILAHNNLAMLYLRLGRWDDA